MWFFGWAKCITVLWMLRCSLCEKDFVCKRCSVCYQNSKFCFENLFMICYGTVLISAYILLMIGWPINENWKRFGRKQPKHNMRYCHCIFLESLKTMTRNLSKDNDCVVEIRNGHLADASLKCYSSNQLMRSELYLYYTVDFSSQGYCIVNQWFQVTPTS